MSDSINSVWQVCLRSLYSIHSPRLPRNYVLVGVAIFSAQTLLTHSKVVHGTSLECNQPHHFSFLLPSHYSLACTVLGLSLWVILACGIRGTR